jgi:hypothetical protein
MTLQDEQELTVALRKLRLLEAQYAKTAQEPTQHPHLRELTLRSGRRTINQLKEEIARYQAGIRPDDATGHGIQSEDELTNARKKLRELEKHLADSAVTKTDHTRVRGLSRTSLKRMINQLKEDIARYETRVKVLEE